MTDIGEGIAPPAKEPEEKKEEKKRIRIRFSLFFDGTLNNRTNVSHRENDTRVYRKYKGEGSFENDKSNIAKLEPYVIDAKGYDHSLKTYVEGPGTVDESGDKMRGYAFGTGGTGVKAKVEWGIGQVEMQVNRKVGPEKAETVIELVTVDVFGFSRGAAGARHCIHQILHGDKPLKNRLQGRGFEVQKVEVCFAGLFDTVSSHGLSFSNDTRTLNLDAVRDAQRVIQLAAAEEYRENFSLTEIQSAGGKGRQIYVPGAHSDVGGGYADNDTETQTLDTDQNRTEKLERDRAQLVAAGWYHDSEIKVELGSPDELGVQVFLEANRAGISNKYAHIPLHIMARFARENGMSLKAELEDDTKIPAELGLVKAKIESYVSRGGNSRPEDWFGNDSWQRELRRGYLHFSSRKALGHDARWEGERRRRRFFDG
jgi:hypothetical protein